MRSSFDYLAIFSMLFMEAHKLQMAVSVGVMGIYKKSTEKLCKCLCGILFKDFFSSSVVLVHLWALPVKSKT